MNLQIYGRGMAAAALLASFASANALVAFDNFGPNDAFNTGSGWTASGPQSGVGNYRSVGQFTSLATGMLQRITIPVSYVSGTNGAVVALYDDGGNILGTWLTSWTFGGLPTFGNSFAPMILNNAFTDPNVFPNLVLHAGTNYWVGVAPEFDDEWAVWNLNSIGDSGLTGLSSDGGSTYDYAIRSRGAFRVEVFEASVPGPAAILPFAIGLLAAMRRQRDSGAPG